MVNYMQCEINYIRLARILVFMSHGMYPNNVGHTTNHHPLKKKSFIVQTLIKCFLALGGT